MEDPDPMGYSSNTGAPMSPFNHRKDSNLLVLEKWFPNGSKGRDTSMVKRVAQQIKTVEFDTEFPVVGPKTDDGGRQADLPASLTIGPGRNRSSSKTMSFGHAMSRTRYNNRIQPLLGRSDIRGGRDPKQDLSSSGVLVPKLVTKNILKAEVFVKQTGSHKGMQSWQQRSNSIPNYHQRYQHQLGLI